MRANKIKQMWREGKCVTMGWLSVSNGFTAEVMARQGFDALVIDMQHGLTNMANLWPMLQAVSQTDTVPVVRVASNDSATIMKALDFGAYGILVPLINTAEDAAKAKNTVAATMDRPANGLPEDLRDHARLMCDIIAIAFQTNQTRVASLIISRDLSAMYYPFLDVKDGHHAASHDNNSDAYERIARFHVSQYAYLASKLDGMKEGAGTVLDNTCLMFLSNLWIGRKHDNFRLPLVLAGGLGGTLETGRTLNYLDAGEDHRKMCSLYLSIMDRFGIKLEQFGDARTRLEKL